jgi:glycosyltransferase involved in cell wall biosynthesis
VNTIQSLGWYFPENTGGTEVYVAGLASRLRALGVSSTIAAPSASSLEQHDSWDGSRVYRYPVPAKRTFQQQMGDEPHAEFALFEQWLAEQDADLYHQHSWTYGCGLHHLRAARRRRLRTVLTIHVPGPICLRGSMMRDGQEECDGIVRRRDCAACWLQSRGLPAAGQAVLSRIPRAAGTLARPWGRVGTALAATAIAQTHRDSLRAAVDNADHVVAVCQWLYRALLEMGVPATKLSLNRQGIGGDCATTATRRDPLQRAIGRPLSVGFLGRWDPVKGPGLLVEAMLKLPAECPVEIQLMAIEPSEPHMVAYMNEVRASAAACPSIRFRAPLPPAEVPEFLRSIDVLAVPSQWMETGPLVVLEAFAAGTPVLGSNLGGIRELVRDGHNGRLLRHDDPQAWADALRQLAASPETLQHWRDGIGPVRSMREVAFETQKLYASLLSGDH